ncbi:MAG TPA: NFACT family protein, partial [Nitrospiraceae bacterium]|nr:NFACT family protein [Nitrospiraceae bacterium]
ASRHTLLLFLSVDPETARVHLLSQRLPNPASPPTFCQFLRAHIQGGHIEGIEQIQEDRIVRIRIAAREGLRSLMAELTGRSADLLVLDAEDKILAALKSERRKAGQLYRPPLARRDARVWTNSDRDSEAPLQPDEKTPFPVSAALERRYHQRAEELARTRMQQTRLAEVRKGIKRIGRRVAALREDLVKLDRYRDCDRYGELLKTNLGRITKGQERLTVVDYFDPALPELVIPLDPAKGPKGNMEGYFKKHHRFLAADREIRPRVEAAERELETLRAELSAIQRGTWELPARHPEKIKRAVPHQKVMAKQAKPGQTERAGPFRRFISADGLPIYVGRNARENEELTFGLAKSDDLWLHAHGMPGSHVVVRLEKGADPPPETIRDAATLALLYSDLKKSGKGEVIYTRRKYVRKVKGQPPGTVTITQEKAVFVTLDRIRLEALKERSH